MCTQGGRFVPLLVRLGEQDAESILAHLRRAIAQYGKPQFLRTDNASVFRSAVFRVGVAALGIQHEFTKLGCPWQNGRIERLFLTLKQHLHGFTPWEVWRGIDPYHTVPKAAQRFEAWGGMLKGIRLLS